MSLLSKIEGDKNPKTRKARKVIRKYKITSANDIPSIKVELRIDEPIDEGSEDEFELVGECNYDVNL